MIVLDTNVLSEAMKSAPAPAVAQWMVRERGRGLFTTAVSEAEIIYGIAILPDGRRKRDLEAAAHGIQIDEATKDLIERATHLSRQNVSDFCVTALADTARRTIAEHETLVLSDRDRAAFFEALVNPPEPNKRLVRAMAEHRRRVVS